MIEIFTDGSALSNSKNAFAGWACYFVDLKLLRSGSLRSTNNYAELWAIHYALYRLEKVIKPIDETIVIKTDSLYSIKVVTGINKAKVNLELIKSIQIRIKRLAVTGNRIEFKHVNAHTNGDDHDSVYNDIVDKEARRQAEELKSKS